MAARYRFDKSQGRFRVRIDGQFTLHGVTNSHPIDAEIPIFGDGIRLLGESTLHLPEYRIKPVTALGGAIKLKVSFDLAGLPESQ